MNKLLLFFSVVLVVLTVETRVEAKKTECYQCFYIEKNGEAQPGSTEECKDPEDDENNMNIKKCNGKCFVQHEKKGKTEHWGRGCMENCKDDPEEGLNCCDGDLCNSARPLRNTITVALLPALVYWINTLLRQ